MIVYGAHAVFEALRAGRATRAVAGGAPGLGTRNRRTVNLVAEAHPGRRRGRRGPGGARLAALERAAASGGDRRGPDAGGMDAGHFVAAAPAPALLVVLDGIEDPHNLGAILRTRMPPASTA